ncbi:MAG: dehydrogenase [Candidatus Latescibacteria bacterium]|nr:dehydrogenase [Candidatus Latescibacterota bacterium]
MERIGVGIVGYGYAGRKFHAYLIGQEPGLRLCAVASRDAGRRAQAEADRGVRAYATLDAMLQDETVRLVVIATPHDTHADLAIRAMEAGRHVVVDKIMCLNADEAARMIAARDRCGVLLSVFHNRRWDGDFLTVRQVVSQGLLGSVYRYECAILRHRAPRGWRAEASHAGSILFDWGAHLIDQALLLCGRPESVLCDAVPDRAWGTSVEGYVCCRIRFSGGALYEAVIGHMAQIGKPRWHVLGDRGALLKEGLDPQEAAMVAGDIGAAVESPENRARVVTDVGGLRAEMRVETLKGDWRAYYRNVAEAVSEGGELAVKPEQVLVAMRVMDGAMRSARTGEVVRLKT